MKGGKGVEVLHRARDGCVDGEELGARRGGGERIRRWRWWWGIFNATGKERTGRGKEVK